MTILSAYVVPHPPLILPEVGRGQEQGIQSTIDGYRESARRFAADRPDTVVLLSPHSIMYADYFHISPGRGAKGDMSSFGVKGPSTAVDYDEAFVQALEEMAARQGLPAGTAGERDKSLDHGSVVPLRFFQEAWPDFRMLRIGLSGLPPMAHYQLGQCIASVSAQLGRRTAIIASGDLSHKLKSDGPYGFAPEGPAFDEQVMAYLSAGDFLGLMRMDDKLLEAAAECGWRAFVIMAGAFDGRAVRAEQLSYEGPFGVGYGICTIADAGPDASRDVGHRYEAGSMQAAAQAREREDIYIQIARFSLETYIRERRRVRSIEDLPQALVRDLPVELTQGRAGAFVTLYKEGQLRGCIGTIGPTQPSLLEEILRNAVSAATQDPRFSPVGEEELAQLIVGVDVLGEPEPIESLAQLDVKRYGVIVSSGARRGLLLPDLDGVDTPEEQVSIALRKAGIGDKERYTMERFEVIRHEAGGAL